MLKEQNRKNTILVKHVTLLHYPRLMEEMRAMAYYSTTVHERKNGWMKNFTRRNRNFRFLFKSLSKYIETTEIVEEVAKAYRKHAVTRVRTMPRRRKACLKSDTKEVLDAITTDGLVSSAADINQVTYHVGDVVACHRELDNQCKQTIKTTQLASHQPYNTIKLAKEQLTILCCFHNPQ